MMKLCELIICVLVLCSIVADSNTNVVSVNFSFFRNVSSNNMYLLEGQSMTLNASLIFSVSNGSTADKDLVLKCWMDNVKVGFLKNWTDISFLSTYMDFQVEVVANRLGSSKLLCEISSSESRNISLYHNVAAIFIVRRQTTKAEIVFRFIVIFFVIFITFVMGCDLNREVILHYFKRPISPLIGFVSQFLFMPLISFGLAKCTNIDNAFGFGLLTIGCSPGGGASNIWTVLFGGDLNLSMTMTFISSCAALFMMPLWMFMLGRFFIDPTVVNIPYKEIGLNLLQVVIPIAFGMLFRWKFETKAILLAKKTKILGLVFIIFVLTFGVYANLYIYQLMGDYPLLLPIGSSLPWLGFIFGYIMAIITRRSKMQCVAIALETGFQNIGIAILILRFSMPQPAGDLGAVMPLIVAIFTPIPLYIVLLALTIKRKCFDNKEEEEDHANSEVKEEERDILL